MCFQVAKYIIDWMKRHHGKVAYVKMANSINYFSSSEEEDIIISLLLDEEEERPKKRKRVWVLFCLFCVFV